MQTDYRPFCPLQQPRLPPQAVGVPSADLAQLLLDCGQGDAAAFASLHRLVARRLRRYALRLVAQHDVAEDVVQESLLAIWRQAASYEPRFASPMTWMSAIVRNKAFDHFRAYRVRTHADDGYYVNRMHLEVTVESPCALLESRQRAAEIGRCMQQLFDAQRLAIELAFMQELTHEEVAAKMDKPLGTIKTWIRRGVLDLRRQMSSAACFPRKLRAQHLAH